MTIRYVTHVLISFYFQNAFLHALGHYEVREVSQVYLKLLSGGLSVVLWGLLQVAQLLLSEMKLIDQSTRQRFTVLHILGLKNKNDRSSQWVSKMTYKIISLQLTVVIMW